MSSFICNVKTYNNIYSGFRAFNDCWHDNSRRAIERIYDYASNDFFDADNTIPIIAQLYALNVEAVNCRYNETHAIQLTREQLDSILIFQKDISIDQFVKSLECLLYQMSEGNIPETKLYGLIADLIKAAYIDIVHQGRMYKDAEWG